MIGPDDDDETDSDFLQDDEDDPIPCAGCGETGECESYCPELAERCREQDESERTKEAGELVDNLIATLEARCAVMTLSGLFLPDGVRDELIKKTIEAMSKRGLEA